MGAAEGGPFQYCPLRPVMSTEQAPGAAACVQRGLIARPMPHGNIVGFAPPLCLTKDEAERIVGFTTAAVDAVAAEIV